MRKVGYACLLLLLASCSAERDPGSDKVGVAEEPLSAGEHCDTAPANATINVGELAVSPQQYGTSLCAKAYLVDVNNVPAYRGVTVEWNDDIPSNPTDCSNAVLMSYFWDKSAGGDRFAAGYTSHGEWLSGACHIWPISLGSMIGSAYRFAISARLYNRTRYVDMYSTVDTAGDGGPH